MNPIATLLDRIHEAIQRDELDLAESRVRKALSIDPDQPDALSLGGVVLARRGQFDLAEAQFTAALARNPEHADALAGRSICCRMQGDLAGALQDSLELARILPDNPRTQADLGQIYYQMGDLDAALLRFDRAAQLVPGIPQFHRLRGITLIGLQRDREAREAYEQAQKLEPRHAESLIRLASLHLQHDRPTIAVEHAQQALQFDPNAPEAYFIAARGQAAMGDIEAAESTFRAGVAVAPGLGTSFAIWLIEMGEVDRAHEVLTDRIEKEPTNGMAWYFWIESGRVKVIDSVRDSLVAIADDPNLPPEARAYAAYALGKHFEKKQAPEEAFRYYEIANSVMFGQKFRHQNDLLHTIHAEVGYAIQTFTPEYLATLRANGNASDRPIFIVGMIRSGTTLLEQIVSSHSEVHGGGELRFWMENGPGALRQPEHLADLGEAYLAATDRLADGNRFLTDKMPLNLRFLGLIHSAFPNARILHINRDPMDTCFSIFATPFTDPPLFSYNLAHIGTVYREYARLMDHWRTVLPADRFLEVSYESLVTESENEARRIIEYLGLQWEDACLHPDQNRQAVYSPSTLQVRQPINRNAVSRWKQFEPWLGELKSALRIGPTDS